jgi:prepilin-type processing-associated H-X9-DG protein
MKQIGLALHNYHSTHNVFPAGAQVSWQNPGVQDGWCFWSAHSALLAYIEGGALYNSINFYYSPYPFNSMALSVNSTGESTRIATFLCPSDGLAGVTNINSYHASLGTTTNGYPALGQSTGVFGAVPDNDNDWFHMAPVYGVQNITDGSSNTIAFGEACVGSAPDLTKKRINGMAGVTAPAGARQQDAWTNKAAVLAGMQACSAYWQTANLTANNNGLKNYRGQTWTLGDNGYTLFNTVIPPNSQQHPWSACHFGCAGCALEESHYVNALSYHPGGCNFTMADGSVKFIKNSISTDIYWSLGTRADGEVISSDAY